MEAKEDGVGIIENVTPEQTVNYSLTSAGGMHKNYRSGKLVNLCELFSYDSMLV